LQQKIRRIAAQRDKIVDKYLVGKNRERYHELSKKQGILTIFLRAQRNESFEKEYEKVTEEKRALVDKYLPEKAAEEYDDLWAKQVALENYLDENDDKYIEKDFQFDWSRCPIAALLDKSGEFDGSLFEAGRVRLPCLIKDCPDQHCWARYSTKPPTESLR
jgi:hypothetical protein